MATIKVDFQVIPSSDLNYLLIADMSEWDTLLADSATIYITKPGTDTPFSFDFVKGTDFNRFDSNSFEEPLEIEDESFTSLHDVCVELAHTNLVSGSVVVTSTNGVTTYTEDSDYEIDYTTGVIKVLSTGIMSTLTEYYVSYTYLADTTELTDGVYTIELKDENNIYTKLRYYLRTEDIRTELDKLIVSLDIYNSPLDLGTYRKITDIELLLQSAEAHAAFENVIKSGVEYDKAVELLELLNAE